MIYEDEDRVEEHCSVQQVREAPESGSSVTLQECFRSVHQTIAIDNDMFIFVFTLYDMI